MFTILIVLKYFVLALCTIDNTILNILCGLQFIRLPWFWILTLLKQQKRLSHKLRCVWIRATWKHNVIFYLLWIICWLTEKIQVCLWVYGYVDQIECIYIYLRAPQSWGVHEEKRCPGYVEHTLRTPLHSHNMTSGAYRGVLYDHVHNPETLLSARTHREKFILGENILFY